MKGRVVDRASVYSQPDATSQPLAELPAGTEIDVEAVQQVGSAAWIRLRGEDSAPGYVHAEMCAFAPQQVVLDQPVTHFYAGPDVQARPEYECNQGTDFILLESLIRDGRVWLKVRHLTHGEGYLEGTTRLRPFDALLDGSPSPAAQYPLRKVWPPRRISMTGWWKIGATIVGGIAIVIGIILWFQGGMSLKSPESEQGSFLILYGLIGIYYVNFSVRSPD